MRSETSPITHLLISEVSGSGPLHHTAARNTKIHHREGRGFWGYNREQSKRPWGAVLAHPSLTWPLFVTKPGAGGAEKGIWAEMTKKRVHPWQKKPHPSKALVGYKSLCGVVGVAAIFPVFSPFVEKHEKYFIFSFWDRFLALRKAEQVHLCSHSRTYWWPWEATGD